MALIRSGISQMTSSARGVAQFMNEVQGLVDRHTEENDLTVADVVAAFEYLKFQYLREIDDDVQGDPDRPGS